MYRASSRKVINDDESDDDEIVLVRKFDNNKHSSSTVKKSLNQHPKEGKSNNKKTRKVIDSSETTTSSNTSSTTTTTNSSSTESSSSSEDSQRPIYSSDEFVTENIATESSTESDESLNDFQTFTNFPYDERDYISRPKKNNNTVQCLFCQEFHALGAAMKDHLAAHRLFANNPPYTCKSCHLGFTSYDMRKLHIQKCAAWQSQTSSSSSPSTTTGTGSDSDEIILTLQTPKRKTIAHSDRKRDNQEEKKSHKEDKKSQKKDKMEKKSHKTNEKDTKTKDKHSNQPLNYTTPLKSTKQKNRLIVHDEETDFTITPARQTQQSQFLSLNITQELSSTELEELENWPTPPSSPKDVFDDMESAYLIKRKNNNIGNNNNTNNNTLPSLQSNSQPQHHHHTVITAISPPISLIPPPIPPPQPTSGISVPATFHLPPFLGAVPQTTKFSHHPTTAAPTCMAQQHQKHQEPPYWHSNESQYCITNPIRQAIWIPSFNIQMDSLQEQQQRQEQQQQYNNTNTNSIAGATTPSSPPDKPGNTSNLQDFRYHLPISFLVDDGVKLNSFFINHNNRNNNTNSNNNNNNKSHQNISNNNATFVTMGIFQHFRILPVDNNNNNNNNIYSNNNNVNNLQYSMILHDIQSTSHISISIPQPESFFEQLSQFDANISNINNNNNINKNNSFPSLEPPSSNNNNTKKNDISSTRYLDSLLPQFYAVEVIIKPKLRRAEHQQQQNIPNHNHNNITSWELQSISLLLPPHDVYALLRPPYELIQRFVQRSPNHPLLLYTDPSVLSFIDDDDGENENDIQLPQHQIFCHALQQQFDLALSDRRLFSNTFYRLWSHFVGQIEQCVSSSSLNVDNANVLYNIIHNIPPHIWAKYYEKCFVYHYFRGIHLGYQLPALDDLVMAVDKNLTQHHIKTTKLHNIDIKKEI